MAAELAQLPGEHEVKDIPPQDVVLSFSETKEEAAARAGKQAAGGRLGYWRILRQSRQTGGSAVYLVDQELQQQLCKLTGEERPQYVPCAIAGNPIPDPSRPGELTLPDSVMFRRFAWYAGRKPICHCDQEATVGRMATRTFKDGNKTLEKPHPCAGQDCPDFIAGKCKRQIICNLYLPWAAGKVAKFRTSSIVSFGSMRSSLLDIANMTGGWLHWLPLECVWDEELVGQYWVPKIRFRMDARIAQKALEEGTRLSALYGQSQEQAMQVKRLQEQSRTSIVAFVQDPAEQAAYQREFYPGQDKTPEVIEGEFEPAPAEEHTPQRLDPPAPEPEPAGEELVLQQPPPAPSLITDLETFDAAMQQVGVKTARQLAALKEQLGFDGYKRKDMTTGQLQALYRQALSDWEAEHAVA